jgi:hypothetical protein
MKRPLNACSANPKSGAVYEKRYVLSVRKIVQLTLYRKESELGHALNMTFSWSQVLDVVADVYNGVRTAA